MDLLKKIFKGDKVIWIIFMLLCVISIIEVFSAASTLTYKSGDHWAPIKAHAIFLMGGVLFVLLMHNIKYKWFQVFPLFLLPVSAIALAFISVMGVVAGDRVNSAARSLSVMGFQFQPSEFAKMAVIIAVAFILSFKQDEEGAAPKAFKYILIITGAICLLIAPENLSTAMLLAFVVYLMMIVGRIQVRKMVKFTGVLILAGALGIAGLLAVPDNTDVPFLHRMETWKNRLISFVKDDRVPPEAFDLDKNGQEAHAHIAIASSNLVGKGPGNSVQRDFLSQAFSDFIFAIIVEELGLFGGGFVVILYIWLLVRAGRIANKCGRTFPAFLVMGIALLLVSQALLNMLVAVGAFPVTGQPLPLISKGGTSTLVNCMYIGMILSVSRYTADLEEKERLQAAQAGVPAPVVPEDHFEEGNPTADILNSDAEFTNG